MEWNELMPYLTKNISFWAYYIFKRTTIERQDAYQELLLILWKQYCLNMKNGKKVTIWYMQKRLEYGAYRIIRNFRANHDVYQMEHYIEDYYYPSIQRKIFYSDYVNDVFKELKEELLKDEEFKALDILTMILEGKKRSEIQKAFNMKACTLSLYIKRKIKNQLKIIVDEELFVFNM